MVHVKVVKPMKKKLTALLFGLVLVFQLCVPAAYAETKLTYVTDSAGLLTEEECRSLEEAAAKLADKYQFGVYIATVDDFTTDMDAKDIETAAEDLYLSNDLGKNNDQSGILLLMSMADRDWALFAFGYGNTAFTDYGKNYLSGNFLDEFKDNDWYGGFKDYQRVCGEMLDSARKGSPIDVNNLPDPPHARLYGIIACTVLGLLVAVLVAFLLKQQMKSVARSTQAEAFVAAGGLHLTRQQDRYTHTTQSRVYDPPSKSSGSKGGTTTRSSGGSSSSGKF